MQQYCRQSTLLAPRSLFLFFKPLLLGITLATLAACSGGGSSPAVNQAPVAATSFATIHDNDASVTVNLQATDANGNNTIASYSIDTPPGNGSISGCSLPLPCSFANGFLTYVPNSNSTGRRGMDKFTFHVTDAGGLSSGSATAWILNNGKVRIMPLGDSITAGITINSSPASNVRIGYRYDLYKGLISQSLVKQGKYGIDFVGGQSDGSNYINDPFDTNHEGHPGWCSDNTATNPCTGFNGIAENVISFLNANPADVILLHIGTNNFISTYTTGVQSILNNINSWAASNYPVTVMVARIIPSYQGSLGDVQTFNNNVTTIATDRQYVKVFMVDQQAELIAPSPNTNPNVADSSLMASALHPTDMNSLTDAAG